MTSFHFYVAYGHPVTSVKDLDIDAPDYETARHEAKIRAQAMGGRLLTPEQASIFDRQVVGMAEIDGVITEEESALLNMEGDTPSTEAEEARRFNTLLRVITEAHEEATRLQVDITFVYVGNLVTVSWEDDPLTLCHTYWDQWGLVPPIQ